MRSAQTEPGRGPYREVITARVEKKTRLRLLDEAQRRGVPLADVVRRALEDRAASYADTGG